MPRPDSDRLDVGDVADNLEVHRRRILALPGPSPGRVGTSISTRPRSTPQFGCLKRERSSPRGEILEAAGNRP